MTAQWQDEANTFQDRDLSGTDYVYLWVDGIHLKVRLEQEKLCLLVMIGVRSDGRKELVALSQTLRRGANNRTIWYVRTGLTPPSGVTRPLNQSDMPGFAAHAIDPEISDPRVQKRGKACDSRCTDGYEGK